MARDGEPKRFRELMRGSGRDRAASKAIVSILRADSKAAQVLERELAQVDLSLPQFNVLMVLAASPDGALPLFELNAHLVSSPPNMSWLSNRMEERGLVKKRKDDADGRVVVLEVTERGWRSLQQAAPLVFEAEQRLVRGLSRAELNTLGDLLGRLLG